MVRETRHLWVGNLPENIREDRIRDHFKRYGRVQSVKLLPRGEECPVDGGSSSSLGEGNEGGSGSNSGGGGGGGGSSSTSGGASATVAFMDIKSAAKAHAIEHTLDERTLTTQYYEPQHLQPRFASHGSSEDHGSSGGSGGGSGGTGGVSGGSGGGSGSTGAGVGGSGTGERGERGSESFDSRGSHGSFYGSERNSRVVGGSSGVVVGGGVGVGGHPADPATGDPGGYISRGRPPASSYHVTSSRARDRYARSGPYITGPPPPPPHLDRHRGSLPPSSWSAYEPTGSRYGGAPPPPSPATNDAYQDEQGVVGGGGSGSSSTLRQHKKQRRKSRSGSSSPSGSSRSGSSSSSRSGSSGGSSSGSTSPGSPVSPHRTSNVAVAEDRRPLAICVRNLPIRSSDTSLKDGLFHEYKKHGKVTWVKVVGSGDDRYALVCFKKPEDVEKALEVSQDKLFFGCKIEVAPYQGYDVEDNEFRPYEAELDEYHPKATRTLFIGNLEKDVTASELRKHFEPFGEIIEIDIKKQGAVSSYAFCQYSDIGSVVKAMRSMDGEHLGANRIKLGFGKSMPTACVWVDGIGDGMSEKYLNMQFHQFGSINQVAVDRERGHALVFFDQISCAQTAVKEMRGAALRGRRLQVDFASRECQETFYEHLERQGNSTEKTWESRPSPASSFDVTRERGSFDSAVTVSSSSSRFTRYDTPPRSRTASYSRTSGGSTPGASPAHPTAMSRSSRRSYQDSYYDGDYGEPTPRRFRSYDEFSQGSGTSHDDYQSSVLSDGKLNDDECPPPSRRHTVQSVVTSVDPPAPPPPLLPPPDIRHLQKERVHLLEQLEECQSSGDEVGFVPKKRAKLDSSSTTILCEDDEPEIASLLVTSHSNRKGMEFRRVSDSKVVVHHGTRRSSCEGRGPAPCKRRRDTTSRHHEHHDGSRPGTPLVDERPENLVPSEPRRFRERSHEGPLSLPLPRFAAQMLNNNNNNSSSNNNNGSSTRLSSASLSKVASPPCASLSTAPSPRAAPQPPASPPPRHASSSPASSDSETVPQSPTLEERIRSLDEMYEKWSGSRALSAASGDALAKLDAIVSERFRFPHKLLENDYKGVEPSEIMKSVLAKRSVFEEDSKRLENFSEKYEPREFTGVSSMIGSTAGLITSGSCTGKVCLQYPFPSHPPVQSTSSTSVSSQVGINTSLSANLIPTTTMAPSTLKTDPRMVHICMHPTPATPITPGTSVKTVSPELPPVSLPIGLGSGTVTSSGNGSGLASASSLLNSNGSVSNIHTFGASTHRGLNVLATVTAASTNTFSTAITTTISVTTLSATTSSATTTTMCATGTLSSMTTTVCSVATASSIPSSSNSSSLSSSSQSSTELPRSRLKKESSGGSRESRDSRDGKDSSRESKHNKGKDCQRRSSRKEEVDVERNRKDRDEREGTNLTNDIGNTDIHNRDFKDNKELRYERKERDKEDRDRQERKDKEDRDRQEKKERDEREKREKDEEKRERERLEKERQEKDRKEREEREKERERERERKEKEEIELKEKERREKERIDREKREREEKERQERREREERERKEREERERKEREIRLEREKQEKERLRREKEEQERKDKEERERLERERRREEKERLERERKREREEKEKMERERRKEKEEREKAEKEKCEKEERERLEKEKHEKRREREDQERREKEKTEREKRRDREEKEKEKKEREDSRRQSTENHLHSSVTQSQTQVVPAPVPVKRRCSSQDGPTDEEAKRMKISDHRRDSKDRSRQNRRSEDRKHRNDSHRSSRESRENRDNKDSGNVIQDSRDNTHSESTRENNSRDNGNKEKQRSKRNRSEKSRERSPRVSHESDKEYLSKLELSKRNDSSLSTESASNHTRDVQHHQQQHSTLNSHSDIDDGPLSTHEIQATRNPSATDTDSDEPKKHSIFDIVDDTPAYISMYDKVKARSTKNMQKLEEEKRQVRLKDKFSQLKQSRARREEKKQSTSWDGDSVSSKALTEDEATSESDSTRTKSLSRKGSRSRIHSDTSEEEESFNNKVRKPVKADRFIESDVDFNFADTDEKQNSLETSNSVVVNSVHANIKEEPRTSDEDEQVSVGFRTNHSTIVNNHERDSRKKSHKKKQKRQKSSMSNENNLKIEPTETLEHKTNKTNAITSNADCRPNHGTELNTINTSTNIVTILDNAEEERMRVDKKQRSKKDKRRDRNGEDKAKARRKRLNRQEARDSQRMEDIFGPLSDDVDDAPSNTFFNRFGNITAENNVYASDSDGGRSSLDMDRVRRKTEKKRRHQLEDENSVDLAEAGREIEAKLLGIPSSPKSAPACTEPNDHDVFRFTDDNDSIEPSTPSTVPEKVKEKKKKRKKSKEERSRKDYHHHHHHHHHHHEKSGELPYLGAEPSPPRSSSPLVLLSKTIISPSLPTPRETLLSPIPKVTSSISVVTSITPPVVVSSAIQASKPEKKKDKFIPGFGIEMDETIHENAVKSISEPDERDSSCQSRSGREEPELPVQTPPTQISPDGEDKPRVAISQEETEDAVAALLEETFGASAEDFSYEGEEEEAEADGVAETPAEAPQEDVEEMQQAVESLNASTGEGDTDMKPDTPQSEHDLQIDTDTEEDPNYETVDLTQPPKTPDIPSFYKSPMKALNITPVLTIPDLTTPEKPIKLRLSPRPFTKSPQTPPTSVIAHSWTLSENIKSRESLKLTAQLETSDTDADCVTSPERTAQAERAPASPPPSQYKPMLLPCNVPITSEAPKSLPSSPRPPPITVQPLYQRLSVSPQSQMVPMRQASPKLQNPTTVSCSSSTNTTPLPPLVSSRIPSLVMSSQSSPRVTQPLSPNGQWSRNGPTLVSPHVPNIGKRKSSPPPTKIAVCMPIPAHSARPETPVQQVYSTAATQQPVIQHASGMLAPVPGYPRGGLPPLTLNIPPRPYMPVPPLASGVQVKNSRDSSLGGKSVIETLLPVNPNELPQRLEEPKLSPAVIPETTHKASTSPKVPSPNQPPTYPPETAKITANMSSPIFNKPYMTDYTMSSTISSRQKHALTVAADDRLSPQKLENVGQLLTTHVSQASTSPVIMTVAHGQSHLLHKSVHNLGPPPVSSPNQPLVKTVVPVVPQQVTPTVPSSMPSDKCVITQTSLACQRQSPVSQSQLVKSHVPLISTVSQSPIITRVVPSTVSSVSTSSMNEQASSECLESHVIQEQPLELDAEAQISQTVQPMLLTPPIQTTPIDEIKQEPVEVKKEDTMEEPEYNIAESKKPLNQTCVDDVKPKQELQETIKMEDLPSVPKVEVDDTVVPKLEAETVIKLELENEIKEENVIKENDDVELDEQPVEDPLKEPSTDPLAIDSKDDPIDSKEDSDYWSAKEVNIESVIKKVDALCDGEGNDGDEEVQQTESVNSDSHDTSKNESDWFDTESAESEIKKSFVSTDDHDESAETCENEVTRSRRGRAKSRRGGRGGVTTRRGRNASNVSHKRGGRSPRGSKHHVEKSKLPADVYEFHDDSEEDNAGRPRLILTIKSPGPNVTGSNAQPTTPVAAVKEVPPEEFVSPAANTRKSRRLAERDGSRNTVDDVIEDVVRGSPANKGLVSNAGNVHATRRSTRHNNTPRNATQPPVVRHLLLTELRKSTRGSRKAARRISENNDDSGEEKSKEVPATQQETKPSSPHKEEPKLTQIESPKAEEQPTQVAASAPQKAISLEPMTLIDPVTGMLIPMRESEEEGQYIPVSTTSGQAQNTNKTLSEPRNDCGSVSTNSTSETPRVKTESSLSSTPAETKKEIVAEQPPCPPTQQIQPQTSVITKSQSPAIQVTSTITVAQSSAQSTPTSVVTTVIPTTAVQAVPISSSQTKPTSLKAHVLNASKLATSTQQQQVAVTKPMPPSLPNQTIVQNIVKPPVQHVQSVQALNLQIPPGRVSSPSLSPLSSKQTVQLSSSNGKQGQPMSPVLNNTGVPPNPKQHLLQAAKQQQTTTIVNMSQKIPINLHSNVNAISPSSRIHQPVSQPTALKGINGQPQPLNPKAHLLQAVVPPLITGTVTSSPSQPHLVNPQPISTGVSNVRPPGPKPPVTSTLEPQKVELPISGCIMPTTSPQARSVPMPTFEAPLHGTGATPPGGQYGLVPPHRSQSPPLPPPAHHHVNTSQSEVVNHYGGLNRGELPPHYLHSQMLQYSQYLRAQQEALTAPRIAYHIPGTRSPHLPLDPKLETGLEDTHSPPLELRRGTRTPQDRTTDSPQVAQVYMLGGVRLPPPPQYNAGSNPSLPGAPVGARASYYEPPPAHIRSQYPMPASEAPPEMGRATTPERCRKHQVVTPPPYASQVPPQADTFQMLLQRYPVMWQGLLALKNDQAAVQMHFVFGNPNVARDSLPCNSDGSTPPLRIAQRMRLEQTQVEGVARKMQTDNEHCMLLALPCGRDEVDVLQQSKNLQTGFIMYLQQKQAAGIVNIAVPGSQQPAYVVHIFPSCDFAHENLARIAPDLLHRVAKIAHLLIVIATV